MTSASPSSSDAEKALFTQSFCEDLAFEGITVNFSSPGYPHQNGRAERSGVVVTRITMRLLAQSGFEAEMWPLAAATFIYLLNGIPTKRDHDADGIACKPFERRVGWLKENNPGWADLPEDRLRIDSRNLKAFGCKAYPMTRKALRGTARKFEPKGHIGYLAGIASSSQYII